MTTPERCFETVRRRDLLLLPSSFECPRLRPSRKPSQANSISWDPRDIFLKMLQVFVFMRRERTPLLYLISIFPI